MLFWRWLRIRLTLRVMNYSLCQLDKAWRCVPPTKIVIHYLVPYFPLIRYVLAKWRVAKSFFLLLTRTESHLKM